MAMLVLELAGCSRYVATDEKYDLKAGNIKSVSIGAFAKDITLTVNFTSSNSDITVGVFKESDVPNLEQISSAKPLAKATGKEGTVTVDVPKDTPFMMAIYGVTGDTSATLKASSKTK